MPPSPLDPLPQFRARALLLGERLEIRKLDPRQRLGKAPLVLTLEPGVAVIFRYGAVVLFHVNAEAEAQLIERMAIRRPLSKPIVEEADIRVESEAPPAVDEGSIIVPSADLNHLEIVAEVLAKSLVVEYHEATLAEAFERIEPLAADLAAHRYHSGRRAHELLRHIGEALLAQHRMVGRVEVIEKPDLLWEAPHLERLYLQLEDEYELRERDLVLQRKLKLVSVTATTALDLLQQRRSLRVEWYIVALIAIEIGLTLYDMFIAT